MKSKNTLIGLALTIALLISTAAPALAVGATGDDLSVALDQGDAVTVTVEREASVDNNTTTVAAENATVTVEALNDSTYAANESFTTDENGTVALPDPTENVTVVVTAAWNNSTASTGEVELVASDASDGEEGEREFKNFGQRLSAFVHRMLDAGDSEGPLGQFVSQFARENNPGADHRNENAAKGQEKEEKRDERAKNADEREKKGGKEKAKEKKDEKGEKGQEKKQEKRNGHAKNDEGNQGDDEETEETTEETTVQDDEEAAETTGDAATTD